MEIMTTEKYIMLKIGNCIIDNSPLIEIINNVNIDEIPEDLFFLQVFLDNKSSKNDLNELEEIWINEVGGDILKYK